MAGSKAGSRIWSSMKRNSSSAVTSLNQVVNSLDLFPEAGMNSEGSVTNGSGSLDGTIADNEEPKTYENGDGATHEAVTKRGDDEEEDGQVSL